MQLKMVLSCSHGLTLSYQMTACCSLYQWCIYPTDKLNIKRAVKEVYWIFSYVNRRIQAQILPQAWISTESSAEMTDFTAVNWGNQPRLSTPKKRGSCSKDRHEEYSEWLKSCKAILLENWWISQRLLWSCQKNMVLVLNTVGSATVLWFLVFYYSCRLSQFFFFPSSSVQ